MDGTFIVPSPTGSRWAEMDSVPLALARQTQGRLFEKHILSKGTLIHPKTGEKINVDDEFLGHLVDNFQNNVCDIVQVPLANDKNEHVENPDANIGEVTALRAREGKLYAVVDARDEDAASKLGKTYLGASAFLSTNYTDSRSGKKAGPTLLHVAVTNRPYVVGLEPYKEIIAATAASDNDSEIAVFTPQEETTVMTKEELLAALKAEHGIDVEALQVQASAPPPAPQGVDTAGLAAALAAALQSNPTLSLSRTSPESITQDDIVASVVELNKQNVALAAGYDGLRRERATEVVDKYIRDGYIFPKQREFAIDLKLTRPEDFDAFLPGERVVPVNEQTGLTAPRDEREQKDQSEEVLRLTNSYKEFFDPHATPNGRRR